MISRAGRVLIHRIPALAISASRIRRKHVMTDNNDSVAPVEYKLIEGHDAYRIGSDGSGWSRRKRGGWGGYDATWRRIKPHVGKYGHQRFHLGRSTPPRLVHRLVLEAFVCPCPDGKEACHKDGDPSNNRVENLYWGTHEENMADYVRHGRSRKGPGHRQVKLTEADVLRAVEMFVRGAAYCEIAATFGVERTCISNIINGYSWCHVTGFPNRRTKARWRGAWDKTPAEWESLGRRMAGLRESPAAGDGASPTPSIV
jgi:hypothetical protein